MNWFLSDTKRALGTIVVMMFLLSVGLISLQSSKLAITHLPGFLNGFAAMFPGPASRISQLMESNLEHRAVAYEILFSLLFFLNVGIVVIFAIPVMIFIIAKRRLYKDMTPNTESKLGILLSYPMCAFGIWFVLVNEKIDRSGERILVSYDIADSNFGMIIDAFMYAIMFLIVVHIFNSFSDMYWDRRESKKIDGENNGR